MKYRIIGEKDKDEHIAMNAFGENVNFCPDKDCKPQKNNISIRTVFSFTNENLEEIFDNRDLVDKRVATVGSSGDQALYSILKGSNDVTIIDANPMTQPYVELKLAAIKNLSFEEFLDFFTYKNIFNAKYYAKISHDLSDYAKGFWDNIIMEIGEDDNNRTAFWSLFQTVGIGADFTNCRGALSYCKDKMIFNKLKDSLDDCRIEFIVADFKDFSKELSKKFDLILLSNISDYFKDKTDYFKGVKELRRKHLKKDGVMQIYYNFKGFSLQDFMEEFKKYFKFKKVQLQKVKDIRNYEVFKEIIDEGNGNDSYVIYL